MARKGWLFENVKLAYDIDDNLDEARSYQGKVTWLGTNIKIFLQHFEYDHSVPNLEENFTSGMPMFYFYFNKYRIIPQSDNFIQKLVCMQLEACIPFQTLS